MSSNSKPVTGGGAQQNYSAAQGMSFSQLAAQQFNQAYNSYAQQGMSQQSMYNQSLAAQQHISLGQLGRYMNPTARYMIDGVPMDFQQFVDTLYPDDCPEKTYLILKLKKEE